MTANENECTFHLSVKDPLENLMNKLICLQFFIILILKHRGFCWQGL